MSNRLLRGDDKEGFSLLLPGAEILVARPCQLAGYFLETSELHANRQRMAQITKELEEVAVFPAKRFSQQYDAAIDTAILIIGILEHECADKADELLASAPEDR